MEADDFDIYFEVMKQLDDPKSSSLLGLGISLNSAENVFVSLTILQAFLTKNASFWAFEKKEAFLNELSRLKFDENAKNNRNSAEFDVFAESILNLSHEAYERKYKWVFSK